MIKHTELNKLSIDDLKKIDITGNSKEYKLDNFKKVEIEKSLVKFDLTTKETKFKMQLCLARGHIDLERLKGCLEKIIVSDDSQHCLLD